MAIEVLNCATRNARVALDQMRQALEDMIAALPKCKACGERPANLDASDGKGEVCWECLNQPDPDVAMKVAGAFRKAGYEMAAAQSEAWAQRVREGKPVRLVLRPWGREE